MPAASARCWPPHCSAAAFTACTPVSRSADDDTLDVAASVSQWGTMAQALGGEHVVVDVGDRQRRGRSPRLRTDNRRHRGHLVGGQSPSSTARDTTPGHPRRPRPLASTQSTSARWRGLRKAATRTCGSPRKPERAAADAITDAYVAADPEHADDYRRLNARWQERERQLDADIAAIRESSASAPYAATESVAAYLFEDLGMEDVTPQGYLQAVSNESEPGPADLKAFSDLLAEGDARLLVVNSQHGDSRGAVSCPTRPGPPDVPVLEVGEQLPDGCDDVVAWMGTLVDRIRELLG